MGDWEVKRREQLEKFLEEGRSYELGNGSGLVLWTGKGGKIEYEISLERQLRRDYPNLSEMLSNVITEKLLDQNKVCSEFLTEIEDLL